MIVLPPPGRELNYRMEELKGRKETHGNEAEFFKLLPFPELGRQESSKHSRAC